MQSIRSLLSSCLALLAGQGAANAAPGDGPDYATAIERWLRRAVQIPHLAILSTAGLTDWCLAREAALERLHWQAVVAGGALTVRLDDPPPGTTLAILAPGDRSWTLEPLTRRAA